MPAGVKHARAFDAGGCQALLELFQFTERALHILAVAKDTYKVLHDFLQVAVNRVGTLTGLPLEWRERFLFGLLDLRWIQSWRGNLLGIFGGGKAGTASEDKEIGERVASQTIRAVQTGGCFSRGEEARNGRLRGFRFHANAAHHVVTRGANFHRALGDVYVG